MRRVYRYLAIIVIILVTAGMLAAFIPDTVLYSLETDTSSSRFHDNVDALKVQSVNSTTDVMPDLQGLLDSPGPVTLNIRIRDVDEARRELALLAKNNIRVNNLIVNLDMSDSAIQDLSKNSVKQRELLQDLLNSSISLDALNNLEIQYRDQNRPNLQVSVQYQKEEILKKINNLRDQYRTTSEAMVAISSRTGLDPENQKKSVAQVEKIVQDINTQNGFQGTTGTSGQGGTSTSGQGGTSTSGQGGTSTSGQGTTGTSGQGATSTSGQGTTGTSGQGGTSTSGQGGTSTSGQGATSTSGQGATSTSGQGTTGTSGQGTTGTSGQGATSTSGQGTTGTSGQGATSTSGQGTTGTSGQGGTSTSGQGGTSTSGQGGTSTSGQGGTSTSGQGTTGTSGRNLQLTLLVQPDNATYGDTLGCFGSLVSSSGSTADGVPGAPVTLFFDNRTFGTTNTSTSGTYSEDIPVEHFSAGSHTLHSQSGPVQSEVRTITIPAVDSVTTLAADPATGWGEVNCSGTVQADRPVHDAPVQLVWDQANSIGVTTDAAGAFSTTLRLPPGKHSLVARFSGDGFPINPSASGPQEVTIFPPVYLVIISAGILSLFVAGAVWYMRRVISGTRFRKTLPGEPVHAGDTGPGPHPESPETVLERLPEGPLPDGTAPAPASLAMRYEQALDGHGLSEAAHLVYDDLSRRIAGDLMIPQYQTLTPREFSRSCKGRSYCGIFAVFVSIYEIIRYAGHRTVTVQQEFEQAMETTRSELEGDDH